MLYIYATARAGYIPQLFSLRVPNPDIIYELLKKSDGRAMIYDPELASVLSACPCPSYSAVDLRGGVTWISVTLKPPPVPGSTDGRG